MTDVAKAPMTYREAWDAVDAAIVDPFGDVRPQRELVEQAIEAIERVRELHRPDYYGDQKFCNVCIGSDEEPTPYPCATVRTLDGEQP